MPGVGGIDSDGLAGDLGPQRAKHCRDGGKEHPLDYEVGKRVRVKVPSIALSHFGHFAEFVLQGRENNWEYKVLSVK